MQGLWILGVVLNIFGMSLAYISGRIWVLSPKPSSVFLALGLVGAWTGGMLISQDIYSYYKLGPARLEFPILFALAILLCIIVSLLIYGAWRIGKTGTPLISRLDW